jgi:AraC family carnitine catabolism transcriptional activator
VSKTKGSTPFVVSRPVLDTVPFPAGRGPDRDAKAVKLVTSDPDRSPLRLDLGGSARMGVLLLPEFPLYALIPMIEAARIANQHRQRRVFDWQLISTDGQPVNAGNGFSLSVDAGIDDCGALPNLLVFGGNHPLQHLSRKLLSWLRRLARHGSILGGVDTGAFALAEAGLLDGYTTTVHWECAGAFRDRYKKVQLTEQVFSIDRDRLGCAGGHATLDLLLYLIRAAHGPSLAQAVADSFVAQRTREPQEPQRRHPNHLTGKQTPFGRILRVMEENLSLPLSADELAKNSKVSERAMNRIIRDYTGESLMRYYRKIRLAAARNALFYTDVPIQEIALSFGFLSPEVFSRTFRSHFGISPRAYRQKFTSEELRHLRPELEQQLRPWNRPA